MSEPLPLHRDIAGHLRHVRRRALIRGAVRGGLAGLSVSAVVIAALAPVVGPVTQPLVSLGVFLVAAVGFGSIAWRIAQPRLHGSTTHAAHLIDATLPGLGSRALSAFQLTSPTMSHAGSPTLAAAHADQTLLDLRALPVPQVVPFRLGRDRLVWFSLSALLMTGVFVGVNTQARQGLHAILHPSPTDESGARVGDVVDHFGVRLRYPSYLKRTDESLVDVTEIQVPRGTNIEVTIDTRMEADAVEIHVGNVEHPLSAAGGVRFSGSFVARDSGPLGIRLHRGDTWLRDRTERSLITVVDAAPVVQILTPVDGTIVGPDEAFELSYRADDDTGLLTLELTIRAADGREQRRRVWTGSNQAPALNVQERVTLLASELLAKPGDVVALWLEATDRSAFDGPNRTRSDTVHVEIASDAGEKMQLRQALRQVLERTIEALALRLEQPPTVDPVTARPLGQKRIEQTQQLVAALDAWTRLVQGSDAISRADQDAMRSMRTRQRRLLAEELVLHGERLAALAARVAIDRNHIAALESDALFVADLLGRAHLSEAEALAAELAQIRKQLSDLMSRLESTDDPQARKEMLAAIQRAQSRLARLMESLASLADNVPGEFVNADALRSKSAQSALSKMEAALQQNDLKTAEEQLAELSRDVDQLQQALRDGTLSFTNDRFGERNRALDSARSELAALTEEQQRLAQRSGERVKRMSERWTKQHGGEPVTPALQSKANAARDALNAIDRSTLGGAETQALDRVAQRLSDTSSALGIGDLLEAERMAGMASDSARELERDLDIMRRMFPGARGETGRNADRAQRATSAIDALRSALQQRAPDLSREMSTSDQQELRADADPQQQVRGGTERLAQSLEGPSGGSPLHNEGAQSLRNAERAMQRAEQALRGSDPANAAAAQAQARDALQAAQEAMSESPSGQQRGRGEGNQGDSGQGHVQIPDQNSNAAHALRQKLLDGMRGARPRGYENAAERYYRELLE